MFVIEPFESRILFGAGGTGLLGNYYNNYNFTGTQVQRVDANVYFDWGNGSPDPKIARDTFSVRWTGQVKPAFSEKYAFKVIADDGMRLWVNHKLILSTWGTTGVSTATGSITLQAAKRYDIQIEYREKTDSARVQLLWSSPTTAESHIPKSRLFPAEQNLKSKIDHAISFAQGALRQTVLDLKGSTTKFPSITKSDGTWTTVDYNDWTAGFFTGSLWQMYSRTLEKQYRLDATALTKSLAPATAAGDDLGFRFVPTTMTLYKFMGQDQQVLIDAAASKIGKFDGTVGMFESVNFKPPVTTDPKANFPVLMDHTMDLQLVYEVAQMTGNRDWLAKCESHLDRLATFMVRPDGSTVQWGYFHDQTGEFIAAETRQGISGNSTWSRGQAWGMYSFAEAAAKLNGKYIAVAKKLADYWIARVPTDGVPYWDFDVTPTASTPKDSSAAAIAASALLQLASILRGTSDGAKYRAAAEKILNTLTSQTYLAEGTPSRGILQHGVKYFAQGIYDNSLAYGDYYFLDALNRYATLPLD